MKWACFISDKVEVCSSKNILVPFSFVPADLEKKNLKSGGGSGLCVFRWGGGGGGGFFFPLLVAILSLLIAISLKE